MKRERGGLAQNCLVRQMIFDSKKIKVDHHCDSFLKSRSKMLLHFPYRRLHKEGRLKSERDGQVKHQEHCLSASLSPVPRFGRACSVQPVHKIMCVLWVHQGLAWRDVISASLRMHSYGQSGRFWRVCHTRLPQAPVAESRHTLSAWICLRAHIQGQMYY